MIAGFTLFQTRIKGLTSLRLASKNWKASNLEILKFEARAPHSSGQILAGFLRLSFHNFFQMTRLVKAFYSKGLIPHGGLGEKVDNSTLKILNQSACLRLRFLILTDFFE